MQKIMVFQQRNSAETKIQGIKKYGENLILLEVVSIDKALPAILDDAGDFLPEEINADVVLDFLRHPDLSQDLAFLCSKKGIPVVASGKKWKIPGVFTPPT